MNNELLAWIEKRRRREPLTFISEEFVHGRTHRATAVNIGILEPNIDPVLQQRIQEAWQKRVKSTDDAIGYVNYDAVSWMLGIPVLEIARSLKALPPEEVRFGVDRMGKNTSFKLVPKVTE